MSVPLEDDDRVRKQFEFLANHPVVRLKRYLLPIMEHKLVELSLKLRRDGVFSVREFFIGIIIAYLDDDPDALSLIEKIKSSYRSKYKNDAKIVMKLKGEAKLQEELFDLSDEDIKDIYSVVEINEEL